MSKDEIDKLYSKLNSVDKRLVACETKLEHVSKHVGGVEKKLDAHVLETNTRLTKIETILTQIQKKVLNGASAHKPMSAAKKIGISVGASFVGFIIIGVAPHLFAFLGKVLM